MKFHPLSIRDTDELQAVKTPAPHRVDSGDSPVHEKHVYCVVSRLLTNKLYISGGYERPSLAAQPPHMRVAIGDTWYCIHFRSLKGGFPEYLEDEALMRIAEDSAVKLMMRRYGNEG